eukprot:3419228-Rhodomonas_salina.1
MERFAALAGYQTQWPYAYDMRMMLCPRGTRLYPPTAGAIQTWVLTECMVLSDRYGMRGTERGYGLPGAF